MQLNHGRFLQNGRCGYILQPEFMRNDYDPYNAKTLINVEPIKLLIGVCKNEVCF